MRINWYEAVGDVRHHSEPAAVRHAKHRFTDAVVRDHGHQRLEHRHERVEPFDGERLLPEEGGALVALHRIDLGEALEQPEAVLHRERGAVLACLDVLAQPHALLVARDVLDLERDRAAVHAPEIRQHLGEIVTGDINAQQVRGDPLHQLLGQAVRRRVHRGVTDRRRAQRIQVRAEMAMSAVCLDERCRRLHRAEQDSIRRSLGDGRRCRRRRGRHCDASRGLLQGRHDQAKAGENSVVEAIRSVEQRFDATEELAGLRPLDDPVVVGAGHGHDLADAEVADGGFRGAAPLRRKADGADSDDGSLTGHQPWDGRDSPDATGIGERQCRALELVCGERVGSRALDEPLVRVSELAEGQVRGVANHRDHERARPVLADAVHGQPQVGGTGNASRLAILGTREVRGHRRARRCRLCDGVADEMGKGHLARVAPCGERAVHLAPAAVEDVDADGAERGRRGDVPASLHVVDQRSRRPLDRLGVLALGDSNGRVVSGGGAGLGCEHVALGHDAARTRPVHRVQVDAVFRGRAPGERRGVEVRAVGVE